MEKKIIKNAISRKAKNFEQSYLDARFATPASTLTATHISVEIFKFGQFVLISKLKKKS